MCSHAILYFTDVWPIFVGFQTNSIQWVDYVWDFGETSKYYNVIQAKHINLMNLISNVKIWPAIFLSQTTKNCRFKKFLYQTSEYFSLNEEKLILQSVKTQLYLKRNHLPSAKFRFCNSHGASFQNTQKLKFLLLLLKNWFHLLWKAEFTLEYLLGSPFKPKDSSLIFIQTGEHAIHSVDWISSIKTYIH